MLTTKKTRLLACNILAICFFALAPQIALALDFRSVSASKAVLYDAPSASSKKVLLLSQNYPVEVVVNLGDWLKVRDAEGALNWIEAKFLSSKRTVIISASKAEIRQSADATSTLLASVDKDVLLEVADAKAGDAKINQGWIKVKHRDGLTGYMLISSTWGF